MTSSAPPPPSEEPQSGGRDGDAADDDDDAAAAVPPAPAASSPSLEDDDIATNEENEGVLLIDATSEPQQATTMDENRSSNQEDENDIAATNTTATKTEETAISSATALPQEKDEHVNVDKQKKDARQEKLDARKEKLAALPGPVRPGVQRVPGTVENRTSLMMNNPPPPHHHRDTPNDEMGRRRGRRSTRRRHHGQHGGGGIIRDSRGAGDGGSERSSAASSGSNMYQALSTASSSSSSRGRGGAGGAGAGVGLGTTTTTTTTPTPSRMMTAETTNAAEPITTSTTLIEATLVTEPPIVLAVAVEEEKEEEEEEYDDDELHRQAGAAAADGDAAFSSSSPSPPPSTTAAHHAEPAVLDKIIRHALQEERERNQRLNRRRCCIGLILMLLVAAAAVAIVLGMGVLDTSSSASSSSNNNSTTSTSPPAPAPVPAPPTPTPATVTARCFQAPIEIPLGSDCRPVAVPVALVDRGSSSSSPLVSLTLNPPGPYPAGTHQVSLVVVDRLGRSDSCRVTIVVTDKALTDWTVFQNHAYRVRGCPVTWFEANAAAAATSLWCRNSDDDSSAPAAAAHLATITSQAERDFVRDLARGLNLGREEFWLGGYQPERAIEPAGNWTWVNGEGLILEAGFTDWDPGEPNHGAEDCMIMLGSNRGYRWDDRRCGSKYRFIEEVDLTVAGQENVMVDGCDSGVPDIILAHDVASCTYLITPGIVANCETSLSRTDDDHDAFRTCVEDFLQPLVDQGDLSLLDKEKILFCGSDNRPPQAVCQNVEITIGASDPAEVTSVEASRFDKGSSDPDGSNSPLRLELSPLGPFGAGNHTVTLMVADGQGGSDRCQATLTITDENQPPVARCLDVVERAAGLAAEGLPCLQVERMIGSQLDNGSTDPEGATLEFSVTPSGPYAVGSHTLTLTVWDDRGYSDTCETTLMVVADATTSNQSDLNPWMVFDNHAYRVQLCRGKVDWATAKESAAAVSLCGAARGAAHLATITSVAERNAMRGMASALGLGNDEFWLGGFQPEQAAEPAGGWTWVNNEGLIFDGYTDWDPGEPNQGSEDCMIMLGANRGFRWDDRRCSSEYRYIEEVSLERTVVIDGCDSGVPDVLVDLQACNFLIAEGISRCRLASVFSVCVDAYLQGLVENGSITMDQKDSIVQCAGTTMSSSTTNSTTRHLLRGGKR